MNQNIQAIRNILQQFINEEVGNKLGNLSTAMLKMVIEGELQQIEKTLAELGDKKDQKKEELTVVTPET